MEELRLLDIIPATGSVCSDHRLSVSAGLGCGTEYNKKADKDRKKRRKAKRIARRKNR